MFLQMSFLGTKFWKKFCSFFMKIVLKWHYFFSVGLTSSLVGDAKFINTSCSLLLLEMRSDWHHSRPFKSQSFTVAETIHHLPVRGFIPISALTEVFRQGPDHFETLFDTGHSTFSSGAEQAYFKAKIVSEQAFPV